MLIPMFISGCGDDITDISEMDLTSTQHTLKSATGSELYKTKGHMSPWIESSDVPQHRIHLPELGTTDTVKKSQRAPANSRRPDDTRDETQDSERAQAHVSLERPASQGRQPQAHHGGRHAHDHGRVRRESEREDHSDCVLHGSPNLIHDEILGLRHADLAHTDPLEHHILVVPITYRRAFGRNDHELTQANVGIHYPEIITPEALHAEFFGYETENVALTGPGHLKHYLEDLTEGDIEVFGTVTPWAYLDQATPLERNKCGTELFHEAVYPEDHPEYDPEDPDQTRLISPVLEEALLAIGIDTVEGYDTLGLVASCHVNMMRGQAHLGRIEVFGTRVKLATSSHPHTDDVLTYWNFPDAMDVSNVSRNMIHEVLHTWSISHTRSIHCDDRSLGAHCTPNRYGSPFSVMGNPIGMFSLPIMDRIKLGVLSEDNLIHVTEDGTFTLSGLNDTSATHRGAYIYWPGTQYPRLALQWRNGGGYDAAITDNWIGSVADGLTVHVNSMGASGIPHLNQYAPYWYLVDPVPNDVQSEQYEYLSVLTETFRDQYTGIEIEVLDVSETEIQFRVFFGLSNQDSLH